jgi:homoserine kinase
MPGIFGVALSGAGPSVLLITDPSALLPELVSTIRNVAQDAQLEIVQTTIAGPAECR